MSQLAGSPHNCYRCKFPPGECTCFGCECGVCKSARISKEVRDSLTAADRALEISDAEAQQLLDQAKLDDAKKVQKNVLD